MNSTSIEELIVYRQPSKVTLFEWCALVNEMFHNCSNQSDGISDYPGYFIRMDDGKLKSPFHQNLNLTALQITVSSVAIPLNLLLMFAILSKHELRSKPRNIFLISVISSDLSAFILSLIEVGEVFLPKESEEAKDQVCKVYMAYSGIPMIFTLVTTLLSLIDRYEKRVQLSSLL